MARKVVYGIHIEADLIEAFDYYQSKLAGLGIDFLQSTKEAIDRIASRPFQYQKINGRKRKINLQRFPYGVYYIITRKEIIIIGILHLMRDPKIWRKR